MSRQRITVFDVLKVMAAREMDLQFVTLDCIREVQKVKEGANITLRVKADIVDALAQGKLGGGLILADKEQFREVEKELREEQE